MRALSERWRFLPYGCKLFNDTIDTSEYVAMDKIKCLSYKPMLGKAI